MKAFVVLTLIFSLWQSAVYPQTGKPPAAAELAAYNKPDREKILVEGAKREGKLLWYTSLTGAPNQQYPEQGKTVEQYEKENSEWEKLLREIGRK